MNEQMLEALKKKEKTLDLKFRTISPNTKYERDSFVSAYGDYEDATKYTQALIKDMGDIDARRDLAGLLYGGDKADALDQTPDHELHPLVHELANANLESMAQYANHNFDAMLRRVEGEGLVKMVQSVPLYTTKDAKYNSAVAIIQELGQMSAILREEDANKRIQAMRKVVEKKIAGTVPEWYLPFMLGSQGEIEASFFRWYQHQQKKVQAVFVDSQGRIDDGFVKGMFKESLKRAIEFYDDETSPGKKSDVYKAAIRPYYVALADATNERDKPEKDAENQKKVDEKKRKKERQAAGLPL